MVSTVIKNPIISFDIILIESRINGNIFLKWTRAIGVITLVKNSIRRTSFIIKLIDVDVSRTTWTIGVMTAVKNSIRSTSFIINLIKLRINGNVTIAGNSQWRIDHSGGLCSLCGLSRSGASSKQSASQCGCAQRIKMSFLHSCFSPIKLKELKHSASILKNAFRIRFSLLS